MTNPHTIVGLRSIADGSDSTSEAMERIRAMINKHYKRMCVSGSCASFGTQAPRKFPQPSSEIVACAAWLREQDSKAWTYAVIGSALQASPSAIYYALNIKKQ